MRSGARIQPDPAAALSNAVATLIQRASKHADQLHRDDVAAVHEFRKAVRRARGLVSFARDLCEPAGHAEVAAILREAFRSTGALRDSAVRLELLDELHHAAALDPLGRSVREALSSELPTRERAALVLTAAAQAVAAALPSFQSSLDPNLDMDRLEGALERANRRVRRAFRRAFESGEDEAFHDWRKRLKDWRAIHDVIDDWGECGPLGERRELAAMTQRFGALTDLILLQRTVQERSERHSTGPLLRTIQRRIDARKRFLLSWGARRHAAAPARVAARLRGALEATWRGRERKSASGPIRRSRRLPEGAP
ncbi:MAG: CHAD domain-containing protein [Acidobacteriota bacterium]